MSERLPVSEEEPSFSWFDVKFKMRGRNAESVKRTIQRMIDSCMSVESKQLLFATYYAPRGFSVTPIVEEVR